MKKGKQILGYITFGLLPMFGSQLTLLTWMSKFTILLFYLILSFIAHAFG